MENSKLKEELEYMIAISKMKEESDITMKNSKNIIKKGIGIVACFVVLFSGIVYAKDIENYLKRIFNNTTEAIDKAVENGYIQQENMDYTYDKDIGIKVNSLILDDFVIINENEKIIYQSEFKSVKNDEELPLYNSLTWMNEPIKLTDTTYADSILFGLIPEKEEFKELYFHIKSLQIIYEDDTQEIIEGNWKFDLTINEEMRHSANITYSLLEENDYVKSATATLSPTGMFIELKLKEVIDYDNMFEKARSGEITEDEMHNFILITKLLCLDLKRVE